MAGVLDEPFGQLTPLSGVAVHCTVYRPASYTQAGTVSLLWSGRGGVATPLIWLGWVRSVYNSRLVSCGVGGGGNVKDDNLLKERGNQDRVSAQLIALLKGHGNEANFLGFLQKSVRHRFLTQHFEPFRFGLRICGDIRIRKTTPRLAESGSRQECLEIQFFSNL